MNEGAGEAKNKKHWKILKNPWVNLLAVLIGLAIGAGAILAEDPAQQRFLRDVILFMRPVGNLYLSLLTMCVTPIIATAIVTSVAQLLRSGSADRYVGRLVLVFFVAVMLAASLGLTAGALMRPGVNMSAHTQQALGRRISEIEEAQQDRDKEKDQQGLLDLLRRLIPPNVFHAFSAGETLAIVFVCILVGIALGILRDAQSDYALSFFCSIYDVFFMILGWALYGLPLGLMCLLAAQVSSLGLEVFTALLMVVALFYICCGVLCAVNLVIIKVASGKPWLTVLTALKEPLAIAFVTRSSVAAIPLMFERMEDDLGLPGDVSNFVVPLGVVINRQAYAALFALTAVFIAQLFQAELSVGQTLMMILIAAISGMAAVGTPAVIAPMLVYVLSPYGLPVSVGVAVLVAISPVIDPIASMTNLFGSCTSATLIGKGGRPVPGETCIFPKRHRHSQHAL